MARGLYKRGECRGKRLYPRYLHSHCPAVEVITQLIILFILIISVIERYW